MLYKYVRLIVGVLILLVSFAQIALPASAKGANIKVTLEEGFDGKVKRGKGFPVRIKLDNNGEAFSGDLLVQYNPSYNAGGAVSVHVELPKGSSKTYQLSLPGMIEDSMGPYQNNKMIHLYSGNWKEGHEVSFLGDKTISPRYIDVNQHVIGVLSENYDRLKEWRTVPSVTMLPLTKEQMPKQGLALEMLDYLVIDEYAVSELNQQQQLAIKEWISQGGVLVAGAAPDASGSYGLLYPLLPMKMEQESLGATDFFQNVSNDKPTFKEIPLFTGAVDKSAEILQKSGSEPATLKKAVGNGAILQTSFSLGDQPLSTWKGYSSWFEDFIREVDNSNIGFNRNGQDLYDQLYYEFAETNEYFPASNYSVAQLILIMLAYLIVIVPILYFVLKKMDKREHSWWVIPSLAVVMSAIVFGLGAKDRIAKPQLNQMGVYQVRGQQLTGYQATTLLSNRSGEYTLAMKKGQFKAVAHTNSPDNLDPTTGAVSREQKNVNEISFKDVGYWSSETIYGKAEKELDDHFAVDLSLKNNQLTGSIQNGYPYDFAELYIWSGSEKIQLGALKAGETLKVSQKIKQAFLTPPTMLTNTGVYPNQGNLEKMKKERLQTSASVFLNDGSNNQPLLAGMTKDAIVDVKIAGKNAKQNNLNLILEPFTPNTDFTGKFSLIQELLNTRVETITGLIHEQRINGSANEMMVENGEYDYIIQLPEQLRGQKVHLDSVDLQMNDQQLQISILNQETGKYLPIKDQSHFTLKQAQAYFTNGGELVIKVIKNSTTGDPYTYFPKITVKGEVTP